MSWLIDPCRDQRFCHHAPVALLRSRTVAVLAGALTWTLAEYGLHRFAMHAMGGRGLASREHLSHHADVTYFSPASKKILSAASSAAVAWPSVAAVTDRRVATAFTAGMITTYFGYEVAHRRIHTHPPVNRYGRWARRHHLGHHFGAPMRNFGVTSGVWDRLLGTRDERDVLKVPRRMAPNWMVDDDGMVLPEYRPDYEVSNVGAGDAGLGERDRIDAFANVAPLA